MKKIKIAKYIEGKLTKKILELNFDQFKKYEKGLTRFETLYVNSSEDLQRSFIEVL